MHQLYYVATFAGMIDSFSITGNETFITTFRSLRKKQLGCHAWKRDWSICYYNNAIHQRKDGINRAAFSMPCRTLPMPVVIVGPMPSIFKLRYNYGKVDLISHIFLKINK